MLVVHKDIRHSDIVSGAFFSWVGYDAGKILSSVLDKIGC